MLIKSRIVINRKCDLDVNDALVRGDLRVLGDITLPTGYVAGFGLTVSDTGIVVGAGQCRDSTRAHNIVAVSDVTCDLTTGLDVGTAAANKWYAVYVIKNTTSQAVAVLLSLSATAPTLPTGFDVFRRVGWVRTHDFETSGQVELVQMSQHGVGASRVYCYDWWQNLRRVVHLPTLAWLTMGWLPVSLAAFAPPTSARAVVSVVGSDTAQLLIREPGSVTTVQPLGSQPSANEILLGTPVVISAADTQLTICTDASQAIEAAIIARNGLTVDEDSIITMTVTGFYDEL